MGRRETGYRSWADARSWNPVTGCTEVRSKLGAATTVTRGRRRTAGLRSGAADPIPQGFACAMLRANGLQDPIRWRETSRRIFVAR